MPRPWKFDGSGLSRPSRFRNFSFRTAWVTSINICSSLEGLQMRCTTIKATTITTITAMDMVTKNMTASGTSQLPHETLSAPSWYTTAIVLPITKMDCVSIVKQPALLLVLYQMHSLERATHCEHVSAVLHSYWLVELLISSTMMFTESRLRDFRERISSCATDAFGIR